MPGARVDERFGVSQTYGQFATVARAQRLVDRIGAGDAFAAGVLPNIPGFLNAAFPASFPDVGEVFKTIYTYAWFVGVAIAALVYGIMMRKSE